MQAVPRNWPWVCCLRQDQRRGFLLQVLVRAVEEAVAWDTTTILFLILLGITTCHINNFIISFIDISNSSNHNTIYNSSLNNLSSKLSNARKTFRK